jgi:hypothetical protein
VGGRYLELGNGLGPQTSGRRIGFLADQSFEQQEI